MRTCQKSVQRHSQKWPHVGRITDKPAHAQSSARYKFYFVVTKPNAGEDMYEQGGALEARSLNDGEHQDLGQEMLGVIEDELPHPGNNQVNAYAQLLASVEELRG